jgi:hypothetical protein
VEDFRSCVSVEMDVIKQSVAEYDMSETFDASDFEEGGVVWFRASQVCAHDRYQFGLAGWGRLNIGLYVLFIEKWLEHFAPSQFLVVRLEDYDTDPKTYMEQVFTFLEMEMPEDTQWERILKSEHANQHHGPRDAILPETESLLRDFYRPYNALLAKLAEDKKYLWEVTPETSLAVTQKEKYAKEEAEYGRHKDSGHPHRDMGREGREMGRDMGREMGREMGRGRPPPGTEDLDDVAQRKGLAIRQRQMAHMEAGRDNGAR